MPEALRAPHYPKNLDLHANETAGNARNFGIWVHEQIYKENRDKAGVQDRATRIIRLGNNYQVEGNFLLQQIDGREHPFLYLKLYETKDNKRSVLPLMDASYSINGIGELVCIESQEENLGRVYPSDQQITQLNQENKQSPYLETHHINYAKHTPRTLEEIIWLKWSDEVRIARGTPRIEQDATDGQTMVRHMTQQEVGRTELKVLNALFMNGSPAEAFGKWPLDTNS